MITDELTYRVEQAFGHVPTAEQAQAIGVFARFLTDHTPQTAMVLRGAAGTGKTSLAAAIVRALTLLQQKMVLMAPTGRAAKVFALYAGHEAFTIHRRIYRQRVAGVMSPFTLNDNLHADTLFIVDEASMISGEPHSEGFGTGCLLDDLVSYVYQGRNCRLLLIGDHAQLPPVGEELSPALSAPRLWAYGLTVYESDLSEVLRQSRESGILWNATLVRQMGEGGELAMPRLQLKGFADIQRVAGNELIETLAQSYSRVGTDDTIVVTKSNKLANIYNRGIRQMVLDREELLGRGDLLMIVKNNYSLTSSRQEGAPPFLANGDRCVVQRVRGEHEMHGFRFAEVTMTFPDYDDYELTCRVMLDTLLAEAPALTREQQEQLFQRVMEDYADLPTKAERMKALKSDAYYNALQVKFGYAVTCHKAQGGQWSHVYIDQGYMTDDMLTPDYLHWLYTALTRATDRVFLVNWPEGDASV